MVCIEEYDQLKHRTNAQMVNVVVACYQQVDYIEQCLSGILMQRTNFPVQILLGDDGSTDGTREICERYAIEHPDQILLVLREQNQRKPDEPAGRGNVIGLLNAANGTYIARCDGDDHWTDPHKLQRQVDVLEAKPEATGCFDQVQVLFEPDGRMGKVYGDHGDKNIFGIEETISGSALCHPSGFLYRRAVLPVLPGWFRTAPSADMCMFCMVANKGPLICIPKVTGIYRKHAGGVTMTHGYTGAQFHQSRIRLWVTLDRHFNYKYTGRCEVLIDHHWQELLFITSRSDRVKFFLRMSGFAPERVLRHPKAFFRRIRDTVVQAVHR